MRRGADFETAVRRGRRAARRSVVVHLHQASVEDSAPPRVGLVVSRAVGGAVQRTAVKRRLRHAIRERINSVPPGTLVVVRATPAASTVSAPELRTDLARALERALAAESR